MIGWRSMGCLAAVAGLLGVVAAHNAVQAQGDKDKLEWKAFDKGAKPFYQVLETKTSQKMTVQGTQITQDQNQTFYIKWTPQDPKDGNWVVKQQIIGVKMDIDIGGNKISFDSTAEGAPNNPMSEFFKALISEKSELTFVIKPDNFEIVKVEGAEDFKKKLSTANPHIKELLDAILSPDALKQMAEPTLQAFPSKTVQASADFKEKKMWIANNTVKLGPIGSFDYKNTYTLGEKDKVTIKSDVNYKPPAKAQQAGLPFVINDGALKTVKSEGYAQLDREKGRIKDSKLDMEISGKLDINIGGNATNVDLQQTQTSTVATRDDDPVEAIKKARK